METIKNQRKKKGRRNNDLFFIDTMFLSNILIYIILLCGLNKLLNKLFFFITTKIITEMYLILSLRWKLSKKSFKA